MGKIKGFMEFDRLKESVIDPKERIKNYNEFTVAPDEKKLQELSDDKVLDFHKRGMFIPLHAMLGSVAQIHRLVKLRNQNGKNKITNMQINIAEQK